MASPVGWRLQRQWARRELYTLRLGQARFDLSQSPLEPGGEVFRTVPVVGPPVVPTYVDGSLRLAADGPATVETHLRFFPLQPFSTVEADLAVSGSDEAAGSVEWRTSDGTRRVVVTADAVAGTISAALRESGTVVASLDPTPADLSGEVTLLAQLQGRSVLVWHRRGRATTYVGRLDLAGHLDLREPATAAGWTVGLTVRGRADAVVTCSRFESALTGCGHADPRVVAYEDGTPVQEGTRVWFLATTRGADIPDAVQGVYRLDVATGEIVMTGALFGDRGDGVLRNDNAGHLLHDRSAGTWTWTATGHSDHPRPRRIWAGSSSVDLRFGVTHLPVSPVAMPAGVHWEDVHPVRAGGRWVATASRDARRTAWLESSAGVTGPWTETRKAVGTDETGQLLVRVGLQRFVVAGTDTAAFVVRDADEEAMPLLGHLDVDVETGGRRVWPALFGVREASGVRWYLLSFDRTSPAGRYSYGRLHLYRQV